MGDEIGSGIEGYQKYVNPSTGEAMSGLYEQGSDFQSYSGFLEGYADKFKLGTRGDYWGGAAGDIKETAKYESGRSKSDLAKEFPSLSEILKRA